MASVMEEHGDAAVEACLDAQSDATARQSLQAQVQVSDADTAAFSRQSYQAMQPKGAGAELLPNVSIADKWTVVLDLTTNLPDAIDEDKSHGARGKSQDLQAIAAQTVNGDVNLVVQVPQGSPDDNAAGKPITYDRYLISDGQIRSLGSNLSEGMAKDLANLLKVADELAPAQNIGLVVQAHGNGANGLDDGTKTDPGRPESHDPMHQATLAEIEEAITAGLAGTNHQQLDLLNFDACYMGNRAVLSQLQNSAEHMVASQEQEYESGGNFDSQNLAATMEKLIANPDMSGAELAMQFVETARDGLNGLPVIDPENGSGPHSGTSTLASFDMSQYPAFSDSLDNLGSALETALTNSSISSAHLEANRSAIKEAVESAPQVSSDVRNKPVQGQRDLQSVFENLTEALSQGQLIEAPSASDSFTSSGQIASALAEVSKSFDLLQTSFYGDDTEMNYDDMGGLNQYFPGPARQIFTPLDTLLKITEPGAPVPAEQQIEALSKSMSHDLSAEALGHLQPFDTAITHFEAAKTESEKAEAVLQLRLVTEELMRGIVYKEQIEDRAKLRDDQQALLLNSDSDVWNNFLLTLTK